MQLSWGLLWSICWDSSKWFNIWPIKKIYSRSDQKEFIFSIDCKLLCIYVCLIIFSCTTHMFYVLAHFLIYLIFLISFKMYLNSPYECEFDNCLCASNMYSFVHFKIIFGISADVLFALGNVFFFPTVFSPIQTRLWIIHFFGGRSLLQKNRGKESPISESKAFGFYMPGFQGMD